MDDIQRISIISTLPYRVVDQKSVQNGHLSILQDYVTSLNFPWRLEPYVLVYDFHIPSSISNCRRAENKNQVVVWIPWQFDFPLILKSREGYDEFCACIFSSRFLTKLFFSSILFLIFSTVHICWSAEIFFVMIFNIFCWFWLAEFYFSNNMK